MTHQKKKTLSDLNIVMYAVIVTQTYKTDLERQTSIKINNRVCLSLHRKVRKMVKRMGKYPLKRS